MRTKLFLLGAMLAITCQAQPDETSHVATLDTKTTSVVVAADTDTIVVSRDFHADMDFSLPFTRSSWSGNSTYTLTLSGVSIGFVSALNTSPHFSTNFGQSVEVTWHMLNFYVAPRSGNHNWFSVSSGLWLNWKNYRMTGYTRFLQQGADLVLAPYPAGAEIKFSRLHFFSLEMPLLMHFCTRSKINFAFGPVFNYTPHGSLKTRYKLNGDSYKDTSSDINHISLSADIFAQVSYRGFGLYCKYSPCNVLQTEYGPKLNGLSAGLTLFY